MNTKQRLNAFLDTYKGTPITYKELATILKISYKGVANRKEVYEARGIVFVNQSVRTAEEKNALTVVTPKTLQKVAPKREVILYLVNKANKLLGLPLPFDSVKYPGYNFQYLSLRSIINYLKTVNLNNISLSRRELLELFELTQNRGTVKRKTLTPELSERMDKISQELFGFVLDDEQKECISISLKHLKGGYTKNLATIQAVAGTSKTTCIKVLTRLLIEDTGVTPTVLSTTNRAVSALGDAQTIASHIQEIIHTNPVGGDEEELAALMSYFKSNTPFLIVDEYSLCSLYMIQTLASKAKRILLVGDSEQLSRYKGPSPNVIYSLKKQYRFLNSVTTEQEAITRAHINKRYKSIDAYLKARNSGVFVGKVLPTVEGNNIIGKTDYTNSFQEFKEDMMKYISLDAQIIAFSNKACNAINWMLNGSDKIGVGSKVSLKYKDYSLPTEVTGTIYTVTDMTIDGKAMCFNGETLVTIPVSKLELAFCINTARAQGSEWKRVYAVLGTANSENHYRDVYVAITRATHSFEFIIRSVLNTEHMDMFDIIEAKEGNRNNTLYNSTKAMANYATKILGLEEEEASRTARLEKKKTPSKAKKEKAKKEEVKQDIEISNREKRFAVVLNGNRKLTADMYKKTEAEARLYLAKKGGEDLNNFIVSNLEGHNEVVVDLDAKELVEMFSEYLDKTEAWISQDGCKAHLIFRTSKVVPTRHGTSIDVLGNRTFQCRAYKPNKISNGLSPMELNEEVEALIAKALA